MADGFTIRAMQADEVAFAINLAADEGWNPGVHDGATFYAADSGGFLVGELAGRKIGCISAVSYGDTFGFIGLYIVVPEMRGQGYGLRLWNAAVERLRGRNIGLDGVPAQQDNYRKSGFHLAYRNERYQGTARGGASSAVPLRRFSYEEIAAYDRQCFPEQRDAFLHAWLSQPDSAAFGLEKEGRLAGYGLMRTCREGWKIGPLFADEPAGAQELFNALTATAPGDPVFLDIPTTNPAAVALVAENSMQPVFETARMYTDPSIKADLQRIFGVTTFELG